MRLPAYPKYKPSGVEWLGEVPAHWEVNRLKWTTSGTVNGTWGEEPDGVADLICVRVADFDRERFIVIGEPPTLRAVDNTQRLGRLLRKGDLLIEKSGGGEKQLVGCAVFFDHEFAAVCSNFVARMPILPRHSARFWSYAHAALYNGRLNYPAIKQTTGIQNLDSAAYLDTRVGFPPNDDQHTIADFLDRETAKIDTLVAKKRTLIDRLKEKRTALISRTVTRGLPPEAARAAGLDPHPTLKPSGIGWFGDVPAHWDTLRLGYIVDKVGSGKTPRGGAETYQPEGILLIRSQNVHGTGLRLADAVFIDETVDEEMAGSRVQPRDILLNITGASIGRCCIAPTDLPSANVNQHVCIVRVRQATASPRFIQRAISSQPLQEQIFSFENGSSREGLNFQQVRGLLLAIPSVLEQRTIAGFLDRETAKIDSVAAKTEAAIERLHEYRTALITAAVTGKIDIRGTVVPEEDAA